MPITQALLNSDDRQINFLSLIKKCLPEKMKYGLSFQYLPESILMVRHYEIITKEYQSGLMKEINTVTL